VAQRWQSTDPSGCRSRGWAADGKAARAQVGERVGGGAGRGWLKVGWKPVGVEVALHVKSASTWVGVLEVMTTSKNRRMRQKKCKGGVGGRGGGGGGGRGETDRKKDR
jgi:hypothetical protein